MSFHIRVRPTALIIENGSVLLIEYEENSQYHYNLPGGGAEPGETITDALKRELKEEASTEVEVGSIAFVYEYCPHKQSGEYDAKTHGMNVIFECAVKKGHTPRQPDTPDPMQTGVKWVPLTDLNKIILYPNISDHIVQYAANRRNIELIEDHRLKRYTLE